MGSSVEIMPALLPQVNVSRLFAPSVWVMGVVNVTPDSFYEGSRALEAESAVARAVALIAEGADVIDLGAESTRPGSTPVSLQDELNRLLPVVEKLHDQYPHAVISIDTRKSEVARACLERGASVINDVSAMRDDARMAEVVAESGAAVVLMHMQGRPETMQHDPRYLDVAHDVHDFFEERLRAAERAGIPASRVILDPGIGFGKTLEHNLELLKRLPDLRVGTCPLLVGVSRKSFLGRLATDSTTPAPPEARLEGSLSAALYAVHRGARGLRVHDVMATKRAVQTWQALEQAS